MIKWLKSKFKKEVDYDNVSLKDLIRIAGNRGYLLVSFDDKTRRTGKSKAILELVNDDNDAVLLTTSHNQYKVKQQHAEFLNIENKTVHLPSVNSIRGVNLKSVFIDEYVNDDIVRELIKDNRIKLSGGVLNFNQFK